MGPLYETNHKVEAHTKPINCFVPTDIAKQYKELADFPFFHQTSVGTKQFMGLVCASTS